MSETKSVNKLNERLGSLIEAIKVCFFFFIYIKDDDFEFCKYNHSY
jgi:hypothetical protein